MRIIFYAIISVLCTFTIGCNPSLPTQAPATPSRTIQPIPTGSVLSTLTARLPVPTSSRVIGEVIAAIPVGPMPGGNLAIRDGVVWVPNAGNSTVSRIDTQTNRVVATVEIGPRGGSYGSPLAVATTRGAVWVTDNAGFAVVRIDPATNQIVARLPLERSIARVPRDVEPYYLSANDEAVWVTGLDSDSVLRIDPDTNEVVVALKVSSPSGIAIGEQAVWVANHRQGTVSRIDPQSNEVTETIDLQGASPEAIAIGDSAVWVTDSTLGTVTRIDPETNQVVATIPSVGARANGITVGGSSVWVTSLAAGTLTRIDAETNQIVGTLELSPAVAVAFGDGSVWVGDITHSSVLRIMPSP